MRLIVPKRCCVPNCRSNYDSTIKNTGNIITAFKFPKDEQRKLAWAKAIPRKNWTPSKYSYVCVKHFNENELTTTRISGKNENAKRITHLPLAVPSIFTDFHINKPRRIAASAVLSKNRKILRQQLLVREEQKQHLPFAVPSIITDCHTNKNHSTASSADARKDPDIVVREEQKQRKLFEGEAITDFTYFRENLFIKVHFSGYQIYITNNIVMFYILHENKTMDELDFGIRILIDSQLRLKVLRGNVKVGHKLLKCLINRDMKLRLWSELNNVIARFKDVTHCGNMAKGFEIFIKES